MAEIREMTDDLDIIQKLDNEPNDAGGLTAAEFKAKFDAGPNAVKKYINEKLIPDIKAMGYVISAETVVTLSKDKWTQEGGKWYQKAAVGIVKADTPAVIAGLYLDGSATDDAMVKNYRGNVVRAEQSEAAISFWTLRKPTVDLKIAVAIM